MAKGTKKKEEKTLEQVLWDCRVALRGIGSTEKNRDAIIGLVFVMFASSKFEKRRQEIIDEYGEIDVFLEDKSFYLSENVYYLNETSRWSYLVQEASSNDIAVKIDTAMADIEDLNPEALKGTLPTDNFYVKLGASNSVLKGLIDAINKIQDERFQEEDLIGRVYEYFLKNYAASGTKDDGEFYTPSCVVQLIAELIEPFDGVVYDPCCGTGGMFVQSLKFVQEHNGQKEKVSVIGQESNPDTWRLAKMNLAIRGIAHNLGEKNASTFTNDLHKDTTVDYIMANPPFNLKGWRGENELIDDPRFKPAKAMPPVSNANYAWILHMLSKLDVTNGIAGFLLANGALNADSNEYEIRKQIIEEDKVEAIIVLPRDMFYTTDISVTLWILNNNKKAGVKNGRTLRDRTGEILFIDLRQWGGNIETYTIDKNKKKKKNILTDAQINDIKKMYFDWQSAEEGKYKDVPELCKSAKIFNKDLTEEEIANGEPTVESKDYSLAPSKYIEFIDHDLDIDYEKEMARIQQEMKEIILQEKESQTMLTEAFKGIGYGID